MLKNVDLHLAGLGERGKQIELLLSGSPHREQAAAFLESFAQQYPDLLAQYSPSTLRALLKTFAYSRFLAEALLRDPSWFLPALERIEHGFSFEELRERLAEEVVRAGAAPVTFARFRRRQLLRILLRDVLGIAALAEVTAELSALADAIVDVALEAIAAEVRARHGAPRYTDERGLAHEAGFAVIALGKWGGQELNYSSDIDMMFVYTAPGETDGQVRITNLEFFKKVANRLTETLSAYTPEGMTYRVDLRLRPEGTLGEVCASLDSAKSYYALRARDWELQMLIKARVAAGRPPDRRRLAGLCGTADLLEYARFQRRRGPVRHAAADRRETGGQTGALAAHGRTRRRQAVPGRHSGH